MGMCPPRTTDVVLSLKNEQKSYKNMGGYANVTPSPLAIININIKEKMK